MYNVSELELLSAEALDHVCDWLIERGIVSDESITLVCNINGYTLETINNIIFASTGCADFGQLVAEYND